MNTEHEWLQHITSENFQDILLGYIKAKARTEAKNIELRERIKELESTTDSRLLDKVTYLEVIVETQQRTIQNLEDRNKRLLLLLRDREVEFKHLIYFVYSPNMNAIKIGRTKGAMGARLVGLKREMNDPLLRTIFTAKEFARKETDYHKALSRYRRYDCPGIEWFTVEPVLAFIEKTYKKVIII